MRIHQQKKVRMRKIPLLLNCVVTAALAFSLSGCTWSAGHRGPPPHAAVYRQVPGPPPHAPAHGYRAKYRYQYYPDIEVYYDPARGCYFWFETGYWRTGYALPPRISVANYVAVTIELDSPEPYHQHGKVKADHPGKGKGRPNFKS
jgi:hypothetical protein